MTEDQWRGLPEPDVSKATDLKDMKADEDYTTTVYVANKSDDGKTADLVYVLKKEIPTYDNTITFNGDGFTVVKEEASSRSLMATRSRSTTIRT